MVKIDQLWVNSRCGRKYTNNQISVMVYIDFSNMR